jgi:hypothetical protein
MKIKSAHAEEGKAFVKFWEQNMDGTSASPG